MGKIIKCLICTFALLICCTFSVYSADTGSYSGLIQHPAITDISKVLASSESGFFKENISVLINKIESFQFNGKTYNFRTMTAQEFENTLPLFMPVVADPHIMDSETFDRQIGRLGMLYKKDTAENVKNYEYAKKIKLVLCAFADNYKFVKDDFNGGFWGPMQIIPVDMAIAYDQTYSDVVYTENERLKIENYLKDTVENMDKHFKNLAMTNATGYGAKHMAAVSKILNSPDCMRYTIGYIDTCWDAKNWFGDGIWNEVTPSYFKQQANNLYDAYSNIDAFADPNGYVDTVLTPPISLNGNNNIKNRWKIGDMSYIANESLKYPNGNIIALNDTHPSPANPNGGINPDYMKNTELNHVGYFGLVQGSKNIAQHVGLWNPPLVEMSHGHQSLNQLVFWSNGYELLPDQGYPRAGGTYYFYHRTAPDHNVSRITSTYSPKDTGLTTSATLAYDDGMAKNNNKTVQVLETSALMGNGAIDVNRRLVMLIKGERSQGYTLDLQRLRGGNVHENFLNSTEDEDTTQSINANFPISTQAPKLGTYLRENGKTQGVVGDEFTEAKISYSDKNFDFKWGGNTLSGNGTLNAYIKGVTNCMTAFSRKPAMRRNQEANVDTMKMNHLYQRREVQPNQVTKFAAIYEGTRDTVPQIVDNVNWTDFDDNQMAMVSTVDLGDVEDIIYVSDDMAIRNVDGISFCGDIAMVRRYKKTKIPVFFYIYGEGFIEYKGKLLLGKDNFNGNILDITEEMGGYLDVLTADNTITAHKALPDDIVGKWVMAQLPDGSNKCYKVVEKINSTTLRINGVAGIDKIPEGVSFTYFPKMVDKNTGKISINGTVNRALKGNVTMNLMYANFMEFSNIPTANEVFLLKDNYVQNELWGNDIYEIKYGNKPNITMTVKNYTVTYDDTVQSGEISSVLMKTDSIIIENPSIENSSIKNIVTAMPTYYLSGRLKTKTSLNVRVVDNITQEILVEKIY